MSDYRRTSQMIINTKQKLTPGRESDFNLAECIAGAPIACYDPDYTAVFGCYNEHAEKPLVIWVTHLDSGIPWAESMWSDGKQYIFAGPLDLHMAPKTVTWWARFYTYTFRGTLYVNCTVRRQSDHYDLTFPSVWLGPALPVEIEE